MLARAIAVLQRWIDLIAAELLGWREARRARHCLTIARTDDGFAVRRDNAGPAVPIAATAPLPPELRRDAERSLIVLELPADKVVVRRISVPVQARAFVAGIVRNQIERLSPWPPEQAAYGFDAGADAPGAAAIEVRVLLAARGDVERARGELAAIGLAADRVVAGAPDAPSAAPVALWSRLGDASPQSRAEASRRISLAIAGVAGLSFAVSLWALMSAASIRAESEELAARAASLQRQLHAGAKSDATAALPAAERAWAAKANGASAVTVIEALSRALPDSAYLTELNLTGTTLRVVGLTRDAPPLIALLERSGPLADVHFFAPTTQDQGGGLFRFHVEARIEPRPDSADKE